mmetsp:Transcript_20666/g.62279  ORF Transcript_20666/g.62279 Transcript_20666/m.62279 type:complete len:104 (-) Transcript_20666:136-447(-)
MLPVQYEQQPKVRQVHAPAALRKPKSKQLIQPQPITARVVGARCEVILNTLPQIRVLSSHERERASLTNHRQAANRVLSPSGFKATGSAYQSGQEDGADTTLG